MNITFQEENFAEFLPDLKEALPLHYTETDPEGELDPDYDLYLEMSELGLVKPVTIRVDGMLAGYAVLLLGPDPHSRKVKAGRIEFYWIHPGVRGQGAGTALFTLLESVAKDNGVVRLLTACKARLSDGKIFEKLGFKLYEHVFDKWLEQK